MKHDDEYEQFLRECWPMLEEMASRLGSWEAVGEQLGRDVAIERALEEIASATRGKV